MSEKKAVPAAPASTAVGDWKSELAKMAVATAEAEKPSSSWISFKGGQLVINNTRMKDDKVSMIVLHSIFENQLYAERYNPNNPQPPICYAFAEKGRRELRIPDVGALAVFVQRCVAPVATLQ